MREATVIRNILAAEFTKRGTADAVVLLRDEMVVVVDLKYGRGVKVMADDNPQLLMYALGAEPWNF